MPQIAPAISTAQEAYDYCNISTIQAAAKLPNGTTTVATFIQRLLDRTAQEIVSYINYDYTTSQVQELRFQGNGLQYIEWPFPINSITTCKSWNPLDPLTAPVVITSALAVNSWSPYIVNRTDNKTFDPTLRYYLEIVQLADPLYADWPILIKELQLEMVAIAYRDSSNISGTIGQSSETEWGASAKGTTRFLDLRDQWKERLRSFKRYTI